MKFPTNKKIFFVHEICRHIKKWCSDNVILNNINIQGEISNLKIYSETVYFSLKDNQSILNCIIYKDNFNSLDFDLTDGLKIVANGYITLYEKTGKFNFIVDDAANVGFGDISNELFSLKDKLLKEGLFDESHKKKITSRPKKVAIITSSIGAAVRDIISIIRQRNKTISLVIINSMTQGFFAKDKLCEAINTANLVGDFDIIILARGGGSLEELWSFNEEVVVRAIFNSKIPIISAIGHETDYTLSDLVSDARAATPSSAAQMVSSNISEDRYILDFLINRLKNNLYNNITLKKITLQMNILKPLDMISVRKIHLSTLEENLSKIFLEKINERKKNILEYNLILDKINPHAILQKGFSIINKNDKIITSVSEILKNDKITISFFDGQIDLLVGNISKQNNKLNTRDLKNE